MGPIKITWVVGEQMQSKPFEVGDLVSLCGYEFEVSSIYQIECEWFVELIDVNGQAHAITAAANVKYIGAEQIKLFGTWEN